MGRCCCRTRKANFSRPSVRPGMVWKRVPAFATNASVVVGPVRSLLANLTPAASPVWYAKEPEAGAVGWEGVSRCVPMHRAKLGGAPRTCQSALLAALQTAQSVLAAPEGRAGVHCVPIGVGRGGVMGEGSGGGEVLGCCRSCFNRQIVNRQISPSDWSGRLPPKILTQEGVQSPEEQVQCLQPLRFWSPTNPPAPSTFALCCFIKHPGSQPSFLPSFLPPLHMSLHR